MENEKLKNQKIGENEMEDVAGGVSAMAIPNPSDNGKSMLLFGLRLKEDEYKKLKAVGYIKCLENPKGKEEYISKTQLKKVLRLINEENKTSDSNDGKTYELMII